MMGPATSFLRRNSGYRSPWHHEAHIAVISAHPDLLRLIDRITTGPPRPVLYTPQKDVFRLTKANHAFRYTWTPHARLEWRG